MSNQRLDDDINLEGITWLERPVSPLELWRYYYETGVLFYNGGAVPNEVNYGIEFVDITTHDGMQRFINEFTFVQPGLRGRIRENLIQTIRNCNSIIGELPSAGEDLTGLPPDRMALLLYTLNNPDLRKEVEALL